MELNEQFFKKVKFSMLFVLSLGVVFIVLTKYILQIPVFESQELLESIDNSEEILECQYHYIPKLDNLKEEVDSIDYDIHQVQKIDELRKKIVELQSVYKENQNNNKYIYGVQCSKLLKLYFDSKEELQILKENNITLEQNLNECKANI
ncbi:MAG: type VI secretion system transmembrane protein TssO [Prolixibacteraceae bacterium]|jgi:hypothetical protein|nr:type VI secretion system transmembrane protein TssO [Prolixibacteraceae bacterium]